MSSPNLPISASEQKSKPDPKLAAEPAAVSTLYERIACSINRDRWSVAMQTTRKVFSKGCRKGWLQGEAVQDTACQDWAYPGYLLREEASLGIRGRYRQGATSSVTN